MTSINLNAQHVNGMTPFDLALSTVIRYSRVLNFAYLDVRILQNQAIFQCRQSHKTGNKKLIDALRLFCQWLWTLQKTATWQNFFDSPFHSFFSLSLSNLLKRILALRRKLFLSNSKRNKVSFFFTVFENHRKSLIQHCERSELRLHFEWTKVN